MKHGEKKTPVISLRPINVECNQFSEVHLMQTEFNRTNFTAFQHNHMMITSKKYFPKFFDP